MTHLRRRLDIAALLMSVALATVAGCEPAEPEAARQPHADAAPGSAAVAPAAVAPRELLTQLVSAYRGAQSYEDAGQGRLRYEMADQRVDETFPMSAAFERPNKLRLQAYDGILLVDGAELRGTIGQLPGQVLAAKAPAELTLESVYQNQILGRALGADGFGIAGTSPQLTMLLSDSFFEAIMTDAAEPELVQPIVVDEATCHGVRLRRPDGDLTLWIDPQGPTLRRIEFPTAALAKQIAPDGRIANLSLTLDLKSARLNGPIQPLAFEFEMPADAKLVEAFDLRPLLPKPAPPSPLLGQKPGDHSWTTLEGTPVASQDLAGKVVVVDFWATWCGPCLQSLPRLQEVYEKYAGNERVRFLAVSTDVAEVTNEQIAQAFRERKLTIPIVRDPNLAARDVFRVEAIPNTFVLGPDGTVQVNEVGANPAFAEELGGYIESLLAGQSVVDQVRQKYADRLAEFDRQMSQPAEAQAPSTVEPAKIAPAGEPAKLRRESSWTLDKLQFPGNFLVVPDASGAARLWVLDGGKSVVEITTAGELGEKHELGLPQGSDVTYLRTGADRDGKRWYAGSAPAQQQCHLFDDGWNRQLSYPAEGEHPGISDLQLADLDADGQLELLIAYWGVVGVHSVTLDGRRNWANASLEDTFSLALSGPDAGGRRVVLCANRRGSLVPIDGIGNAGNDLLLSGRYFRLIASADLTGDGQAEYCGVSLATDGSEQVVGLTSGGEEAWSHPLPRGVHVQPVEMLQAGNLLGDETGQWVIACPDGAVLIVAASGELIDRFNYGESLAGLAVWPNPDGPLLVVSSRNATGGKLEALRLSRP
ncbi:MAG: redoxin domain-containing protein [Pirellulales bacterium]|nr:redoxin domain-containing protein [Pirellulales bacterium]